MLTIDNFPGLTKGGFSGCSPGTKPERGYVRIFPGTKTGTRVRSHVPTERKPERGYVRQTTLLPETTLLSPSEILAFLLIVGAFSLTILALLLTIGAFCLHWESASDKDLKGL